MQTPFWIDGSCDKCGKDGQVDQATGCCEDCIESFAETVVCQHCGSEIPEDVDQGDETCERCRVSLARDTWMSETIAAVEALAERLSWSVEDRSTAQTGSVYITLERECDAHVLGMEDDWDCECRKVVVRVSDHGTCYETEDVSLSYQGGDHTLATLERVLSVE